MPRVSTRTPSLPPSDSRDELEIIFTEFGPRNEEGHNKLMQWFRELNPRPACNLCIETGGGISTCTLPTPSQVQRSSNANLKCEPCRKSRKACSWSEQAMILYALNNSTEQDYRVVEVRYRQHLAAVRKEARDARDGAERGKDHRVSSAAPYPPHRPHKTGHVSPPIVELISDKFDTESKSIAGSDDLASFDISTLRRDNETLQGDRQVLRNWLKDAHCKIKIQKKKIRELKKRLQAESEASKSSE